MKKILLSCLLVMAAGVSPAAAQTYAERYGTKLVLGGNASGTTPLTILAPAAGLSSYTLTLPQTAGSIGQTLVATDAFGTLGWMNLSGTNNYIPKWSGSNLANSSLSDDGTTITTSENFTLSGAKTLRIGTASTASGSIALANSSSSNLTTLQSGNATSAVTYQLPTSNGTNGQVLATDGNNPAQLRWASAGSGNGLGAVGASYLARAPLNTYSNTGATSNTPVNVEGIGFPIGAGEIWSFKMDISVRCATNSNGMTVGFSLPTGALIEAQATGLVDVGANGHTTFDRITAAGQMVGPFNLVTNNDAGISIFGTVDNSLGSAGIVRLQIAAPASGDAGLKTVYKNSFVTAWQYAVAYERTYTTSTTYTIPSGITKIYASGVSGAGGGGGGGGDNSSGNGGGSGGGGGAGEYVPPLALTVTPGETLTITVGAGGSGGTAGTSGGTLATNGSAGTQTMIVGSVSGTLLVANGGSGGGRGHNSFSDPVNGAAGTAGAGGTGSSTTGHLNGSTGTAGVAGSKGNDRLGGAGGSGPAPGNAGGRGGTGNGNNSNGTAGDSGANGYVIISY